AATSMRRWSACDWTRASYAAGSRPGYSSRAISRAVGSSGSAPSSIAARVFQSGSWMCVFPMPQDWRAALRQSSPPAALWREGNASRSVVGDARPEAQFHAVLQAQGGGLAGIELQHVAGRGVAGVDRAGPGVAAGLRPALLRDQAAGAVEVQDVQRDAGVLHPVRQRFLAVVDEQHAVARRQPVAVHQALGTGLGGVGELDRDAPAGQF